MSADLFEIIERDNLQSLLDSFFHITGLPSGILDRDGHVLASSGWTRLCSEFHRQHPGTLEGCLANESTLVPEGSGARSQVRTCPNGLMDVAIPIVVEEDHLATFHFSQFLLKEPDLDFFRSQAVKHGFDEDLYMKAVADLPILSRERMEGVSDFFQHLVSLLALKGLRLRRLQQAEQTLRASEQRLKKMIETMPVLIHAHDDRGRYIYWNREAEKALGYSAQEVISDPDIKKRFYPNEKYRRWVEQWHGKRKQYKDKAIEMVAKDGTPKVILWSCPAEAPPLPGWDMWEIGRDVTEQVRVQEALRDSERQYRTIIENAVEGIFRSTFEGRFVAVNPAMARMLGYDAPRDMMESISDLTTQFYAEPSEREKLLGMLEQNGIVANYEFQARRKDGTIIWCRMNVRSVCDASDKVCWIEGTLMDVTDRKKLEGQLLQAQKLEAIGQLAAGIAHEINTPAQYVRDNIRFLQDSFGDLMELLDSYQRACQSCRDGGALEDIMESIQQEVEDSDVEFLSEEIPLALEQAGDGIDRIATIVASVKEFAHPGVQTKTPVDLNRAVQNSVMVTQNEWKYVAEVRTCLASDLPQVLCHPSELNQLLVILIVNAAHAIEEALQDRGGEGKGTITISTLAGPTMVELQVKDDGTGIPEKIRDRIFDPFFTTKEVGKGTGQGLSLAHTMVVDNLGGTIDFETEMGRGTTFRVCFPLQDMDEENGPVKAGS